MTDVEIIPILNTELQTFWPFVKKGLEQIKARWPVDWIPEDVFSTLRNNNAELVVAQRGERGIAYYIAYRQFRPWSNLPEYFIWILWSISMADRVPEDEEAREKIVAFMKARARQLGCYPQPIACQSPRKGLEKMGFKPYMITYRMPL